MKTYIVNIIPKIQEFSRKLDDLTLLTNKHWVVIDEANEDKSVYIFRNNKQLLISYNGKVEKATWEYLGNNSLLIDKKNESYLFKHGFFDENILALKIDGKKEYAFLVNENKFEGELNSIDAIVSFLINEYLKPDVNSSKNRSQDKSDLNNKKYTRRTLQTDKGKLVFLSSQKIDYAIGDVVYLDGKHAPDGKYKYGWPSWLFSVIIKDGKLSTNFTPFN
jgi:hypothetical protein